MSTFRLVWRVRGVAEVQAALEGLCRVALVQLVDTRPALPLLYQSGVRYRQENRTEWWLGPRDVYARGHGDCEDLVAWRVAELRRVGEPAEPACYAPRPGLVHCVVKVGQKIEDPSRLLGMGGEG